MKYIAYILIIILCAVISSFVFALAEVEEIKENWDIKNEYINNVENLYKKCIEFRNSLYEKDKEIIDLKSQLKLLKNEIEYSKNIKNNMNIMPVFNINAGVGFVNKDPVPFISMGVGIAFK